MAEEIEWWEAETVEELVDAVAGDVAFIIESALDARGQALIALPGGNTPKPILEKLAQAPLRWKNVTIIPTDERLVPLDSPLSNVAMLAKIFLPKGARVLPYNSEAADYKLAGSAANARLSDLHFPLDLVWLGMGADGHTASIFPGPDLEAAFAAGKDVRAIGVAPDPLPSEAPVNRVTLTPSAIASARTAMLVINGGEKRRVLEQAIDEGAKSAFPVGRLLDKLTVPLDIHCLMD
ncbi:MAG: 6-phosphogluconolactonase [Sphingomonadales bacterium]|jgi:6-phosphogluconolactonase|uniref:6-phosphogluconolactonase n=1 Tax=Sphingorhabdus sp. TaxID=1902408 RepID=UPI003BB04318|nr:6-phosphogluconolactonase [Sphingomonadales bacterium]MBK9433053.1 6-phosphogluconolactonase [Sphingomonadales bacterium]MBL0021477.1 6-phosphogluconolactonase [Sphingomonadales bacterium]